MISSVLNWHFIDRKNKADFELSDLLSSLDNGALQQRRQKLQKMEEGGCQLCVKKY